MTIRGALIAENLRINAALEGVPLTATKVWRADAGDVDVAQPRTWAFIDFEAPADQADALAHALSRVLDPSVGWYCDFRSNRETFVVFGGRVFRYPRGDRERRAEVEAYARSVGVPEPQLDWPE